MRQRWRDDFPLPDHRRSACDRHGPALLPVRRPSAGSTPASTTPTAAADRAVRGPDPGRQPVPAARAVPVRAVPVPAARSCGGSCRSGFIAYVVWWCRPAAWAWPLPWRSRSSFPKTPNQIIYGNTDMWAHGVHRRRGAAGAGRRSVFVTIKPSLSDLRVDRDPVARGGGSRRACWCLLSLPLIGLWLAVPDRDQELECGLSTLVRRPADVRVTDLRLAGFTGRVRSRCRPGGSKPPRRRARLTDLWAPAADHPRASSSCRARPALIDEIVWSRQLVLVFGNYDAGRARRSWPGSSAGSRSAAVVGGRIADRVRSRCACTGSSSSSWRSSCSLTPFTFRLINGAVPRTSTRRSRRRPQRARAAAGRAGRPGPGAGDGPDGRHAADADPAPRPRRAR